MNNPARFQPSAERGLLAARLRAVPIGEFISYGDLTDVCGANVQTSGRSKLDSARRLLRKEGIEFETLPNDGLRRLSEQEKEKTLATKSRRIKRQAADQITIIDQTDFRQLPKEVGDRFVLRRTIAYVVQKTERESTVKKLGNINAAVEAARKAIERDSGPAAILRALGVSLPKDVDIETPAGEE